MSIVFLAEKPITVGWGKKETQFHGSVGKPTAANIREIVSSTMHINMQVSLPSPGVLIKLEDVVRNWI